MKKKTKKKEIRKKDATVKKTFAVKTHYLIEVKGKAKNIDKFFNKNISMYEERIILVIAKSFDEAIIKAEKEALEYASYEYYNRYSQKIKTRYLKACDAFELCDPIENLSELFSSTHLYDEKNSIKKILDSKVGKINDKNEMKLRRMFYNKDFTS